MPQQPPARPELAGYLYPWDVVGDPAAPEQIAALGLDHVVLAGAYHATRALTPRHPAHRVVVAEHSARYFAAGAGAGEGSGGSSGPGLAPSASSGFTEAAAALRAAGVRVHGWAVFDHVDLWPGADATDAVRNAYGDAYPWARCPARPGARAAALALAADLAAQPGIDGWELEALGWFGYDHLHEHDKTGGIAFDAPAKQLLSLCFCDACAAEYRAEGLDPERLRQQVRAALDPAFAGRPTTALPDGTLPTGALPDDVLAAVTAMRERVGRTLRAEVLAALRSAAAPGVRLLLHADPDPLGSGSFTGLDVAATAPLVDGLVVNCWSGPALTRTAAAQAAGTTPVLASLLAVAGMGGRPQTLAEQLAAVPEASGARLYHLGLAGAADLAAVAAFAAAPTP